MLPPQKLSFPLAMRHKPATDSEIYHYLPIPDEVFHSGFYVTSVGHTKVAPRITYPPAPHPRLYHFDWKNGRILPEFSLNIISEGHGVFESKETGEVAIAAGSALLLSPGMWHRYRPDTDTGWTETWMHFNGEFAHRLLQQEIISSKNPVLQGPHLLPIVPVLQQLLARVHRSPSANTLFISLQGMSVLGLALAHHVAPASHPPKDEIIDPLVSSAQEFIWSHSHQVLSVNDVAEAVGVTRRTLERHMMHLTGRSLLDAIIDCRYSRAERLLRETDVPIKSIATLAGFGSLQNLRYVFAQRSACSLAEYREKFRPAALRGSDLGPQNH